MTADEFSAEWFRLEENASASPNTGIKINLDGLHYYDLNGNEVSPYNYSTFRFADNTASKNVDLTNIIVSSGEKNEEEPDKSTYKEYSLDPEFDKDTTKYEVELLEYKDELDIKAILSDTKSTMKIKVPKRDEDDKLLYETDGTTIIYEEKDLQNDKALQVAINKLGEPDTKIIIKVTAEDKITTKEYELVIKRPCGKITGKVQLGETLRGTADSYGIFLEYIADIKIYETNKFIWSDLLTDSTDFSILDAMKLETSTKSDGDTGEFTIYVIPGEYDVFIEKFGYTQAVNTNITVENGVTIDLGEHILQPGDIDRNGYVDALDLKDMKDMLFLNDSTDPSYKSQCDFLGKGYVDAADLKAIKDSLFELKTIDIR